MKTPKWICEKCQQTFTRRWNADRHYNNKHDGTLYSVILFKEYLASKGNSKFLRLLDKYSENANHITYPKNLFFQAKTNPLLEPQFKSSIDPIEDYLDKEILLADKLHELAPQYQQLENLLSHIPEPNRRSILGSILTRALNSESPDAFIHNQLEGFRRAKTRNRMLDDISASLGFDKNMTKEFLKMGLKTKSKNYY
jgi:hypothetical protein